MVPGGGGFPKKKWAAPIIFWGCFVQKGKLWWKKPKIFIFCILWLFAAQPAPA